MTDLIKSMKEAIDFANGIDNGCEIYIPDEINTKLIREKLEMSQSKFAQHYGFNLRTLQQWEQGRLVPHPDQQMYLCIISKEPKVVEACCYKAA